jgi:hypothetical protein
VFEARVKTVTCSICGGEMVQKSRLRLLVVGLLMIAATSIAFVVPHFWSASVILFLTGAYLVVWAVLGRGAWCRQCKRFNISG